MTLSEIYKAVTQKGVQGERARMLLLQSDWLARMIDFDPRSGEALTQAMTPFLRRVSDDLRTDGRWKIRDRLARLTDHCRGALGRIFVALNETPRREHSEIPLRDVRELDAACFRKLSNRPGRTIREKLASKPYLTAVRRFQSMDLPENQLVKAFCIRLVELLRDRSVCLGSWLNEVPDELIEVLDHWLHSDEARAISRWNNPPPNNVLLSHRDYRKVYDSWRWIQSLDSDTAVDFSRLDERQACVDYWQYIADLRFHKDVLLDEVPIRFAYDEFRVQSFFGGGALLHGIESSREIPIGMQLEQTPKERSEDAPLPVVETPVCVDFASRSLTYATRGGRIESLSVPLAWQYWKSHDENVEMSLFDAQAIHTGDCITTIRASDFFTASDSIREHAYEAAMSIAVDMRRVFRNDTFVWLVPDIVDDFQLTPLRQGINAQYLAAEPVPRSIAAAVEKVNVNKIAKDGFAVAVIDRMGDEVFVTKLVARYDEKLLAALPKETRGYAWERQPAVRIDSEKIQDGQVDFCELVKLVGQIVYTVYVKNPPVRGGLLLREREIQAKDIPLWYDRLPELSTKIPIDGVYDYFYFVEKREAISPRRGVARPIPIKQEFVLPAGRREYEFPLYMGSDHGASQFVASLRSSAFPLKSAVKCTLKMTYTYGDIQPYSLTFHPQDKALKPMTAVWEEKKPHAVDWAALPVPDFPVKNRWDTLAKDGFLQQVADGFDEIQSYVSGSRNNGLIASRRQKLDSEIAVLEGRRRKLVQEIADVGSQISELNASWKRGVVNSYVLRDKKDTPYCFVSCDHTEVFCHSADWAGDISCESLARGENVWLCCQRNHNTGKFVGMWMSRNSDKPRGLGKRIADKRKQIDRLQGDVGEIDRQVAEIRERQSSVSEADVRHIVGQALRRAVKACRIPVSTVWDNARSCRDGEAPEWFRQHIGKALRQFDADLQSDVVPTEFKTVLSKLLYLLHKDIPMSLVEADKRDIAEHGTDAFSLRHMGYALGDAGMDWQRELLVWMLAQADYGYFPVFRAFSISLWRCESLVRRLQPEDCRVLCRALKESIGQIIDRIESVASLAAPEHDHARVRLFVASARYNFEVMLALIRTRKGADAEVARMFVPGSPMSVMLLDMVDSFAKVLFVHHLKLDTRISLNIDKPEQVGNMSDLLYALRLYLSGDDGANTIAISEVGDDEAGDEGNPHESKPASHRDSCRPSPEVFAQFRNKIVALGQSVHVRYRPDKDKIRELQKEVWVCHYRTKAYEERPWEQAFICIHPQYGCRETHGGICTYWNKMGGPTSSLGLPVSDEEDFYESNRLRGRISHFEHGDIIWLNDENRIDVRMKS